MVCSGVAALKRKGRGKAKGHAGGAGAGAGAGNKLVKGQGKTSAPPLDWDMVDAEPSSGGGKKDPWSETMDMR